MNKISDRILEEIIQRCDITDVVSSYIPLKKAGRNFKALCPFHHEKSPSFIVSPDKQIFHCFGCGAGGDVFSFIMKNERMDFPEAVRFLADKVGVKIESVSEKQDTQSRSVATLLYKINELASWYFEKNLTNAAQGKQAQDYLQKRGIDNEIIKTFRIGFAPDTWDGLLLFLKSKRIDERLLLKSGLFVQNAQGRIYDRFRNRIMFPIFNSQGKIIGFGGRALEQLQTRSEQGQDRLPKYINSPETAIYIKSKNLYGLNLSKKSIQEKKYCIVVEGYLDFIIPFQAGIKNLVASLGTAFTSEHVRILRRYANNVVILFDSDAAGQGAALRSLDLLLEEGMNVRIAELKAGFDPDSFIREFGEKEFKETIKSAKTLFDYKLDLLALKLNKDIPEEKVQIATQMLDTISRMKNAILRATYLSKLSEALSINEEALIAEFRKIKSGGMSKPAVPSIPFRLGKKSKAAEEMLISLMFEDASLIKRFKEKLHYSEFSDPVLKRIAEELFNSNDDIKPTDVINRVNDERVSSFLCNLLVCDMGIENQKKSFEDCIKKIKRDNIQIRLNELQHQIKSFKQSDNEELKKILQEYHCLKKEQRVYEKEAKK